ncbi:PREDICTED: uncharacterized protein LOC105563655 [Vollenhovia emeryi]|uniref:uncharacterized protein LOC105563655 n=1 Tax=Vollenhovia emeryi TaxID=411798 RepID=UPI0005F42264|nr:PREDICTED: uncharacterized protein LOC105563655 [Vollenhovia emeryi]
MEKLYQLFCPIPGFVWQQNANNIPKHLHNLNSLTQYADEKCYKVAIPLCKKVLHDLRNMFNPVEPEVTLMLNTFALVCIYQNKYREAANRLQVMLFNITMFKKEMLDKSAKFPIDEAFKRIPWRTPSKASTLGDPLKYLDVLRKAQKKFKRLLQKRTQEVDEALDTNCHYLALSKLNNLLYSKYNESKKKELRHFRERMETKINKQPRYGTVLVSESNPQWCVYIFDENNPIFADIKCDLARSYARQGNYEKAEELYQQVLDRTLDIQVVEEEQENKHRKKNTGNSGYEIGEMNSFFIEIALRDLIDIYKKGPNDYRSTAEVVAPEEYAIRVLGKVMKLVKMLLGDNENSYTEHGSQSHTANSKHEPCDEECIIIKDDSTAERDTGPLYLSKENASILKEITYKENYNSQYDTIVSYCMQCTAREHKVCFLFRIPRYALSRDVWIEVKNVPKKKSTSMKSIFNEFFIKLLRTIDSGKINLDMEKNYFHVMMKIFNKSMNLLNSKILEYYYSFCQMNASVHIDLEMKINLSLNVLTLKKELGEFRKQQKMEKNEQSTEIHERDISEEDTLMKFDLTLYILQCICDELMLRTRNPFLVKLNTENNVVYNKMHDVHFITRFIIEEINLIKACKEVMDAKKISHAKLGEGLNKALYEESNKKPLKISKELNLKFDGKLDETLSSTNNLEKEADKSCNIQEPCEDETVSPRELMEKKELSVLNELEPAFQEYEKKSIIKESHTKESSKKVMDEIKSLYEEIDEKDILIKTSDFCMRVDTESSVVDIKSTSCMKINKPVIECSNEALHPLIPDTDCDSLDVNCCDFGITNTTKMENIMIVSEDPVVIENENTTEAVIESANFITEDHFKGAFEAYYDPKCISTKYEGTTEKHEEKDENTAYAEEIPEDLKDDSSEWVLVEHEEIDESYKTQNELQNTSEVENTQNTFFFF